MAGDFLLYLTNTTCKPLSFAQSYRTASQGPKHRGSGTAGDLVPKIMDLFVSKALNDQERHQNLAASIPLCLEGSQRRQWPISSPEVACFKVWYLEFVAQGSRHLLLPVLFARCMCQVPINKFATSTCQGCRSNA